MAYSGTPTDSAAMDLDVTLAPAYSGTPIDSAAMDLDVALMDTITAAEKSAGGGPFSRHFAGWFSAARFF